MNRDNNKKVNPMPQKRPIRKQNETRTGIKILKIVGTVFLSMFLIMVITGSILATALTIYIMNFADSSTSISLDHATLGSTTSILAENPDYNKKDANSEKYALYYQLSENGEKRVWADFSEIPKCVKDAFQTAEDARFYSHDGVDFKRTLASFANLIFHFWDTEQGGSTITQQTIKNITGDSATSGSDAIARKIREIFRSINVEKNYTKDEILEAYLNIVPLGNNVCGVQAAANFYFGKDVSELSIKEAASLAAITPSPSYYNPYDNPEINLGRTNDFNLVLMRDNGAISSSEYDEALAEKLVITGDKDYSSKNTTTTEKWETTGVTSFYIDATIREAIQKVQEYEGIDYDEAKKKVYGGGYRIITNVDLEMQQSVEKKYLDASNFQLYPFENDKLQSSFIAMDYNGNIKAVVGARGKKTTYDSTNFATMETRQPGSSIKPIASYAPAVDKDLITWSTLFNDKPITISGKQWPVNYSEVGGTSNWSYNNYFTYQMLFRSLNTCPAQIVQKLTPSYCFNFLQNSLHISSLVLNDNGTSDANYAPMVVGALTNGLYLEELVASYQIFGNKGRWSEPTFISSITDSVGNVIFEDQNEKDQVISESSSYVMNRMMRTVITEPQGTGRYASIPNVELIGKTGTSDKWYNLTFVGCTPAYVSGVWLGFKNQTLISSSLYQNVSAVWKNVFGDIANSTKKTTFDMPDSVKELNYCTKTGLIASNSCWSTAKGYYKESNIPTVCTQG